MGCRKTSGNAVVTKVLRFVLISCLLGGAALVKGETSTETIDFKPCQWQTSNELEVTASCGDVTVPLDANNPGSGSLILPVVKLHAQNGARFDPVFLLQGGPGASNIWHSPLDWMFRDQDLVMIGYRGADGPVQLLCPDFSDAQLGDGSDLLSEQSRKIFSSGVKRCVVQLQDRGISLNHFTIMQVMDDIEHIRQELGYTKINLLSESYGTRVALLYGWKYPASINRSVMIGVNPPGHFVWEPHLIDKQLHYMARLCQQDAYCSSRTSDLAATMKRVSHDMPSSWLGWPIDAGMVKFIGVNMLHNRGGAAMLYDSFLAAGEGDASGLALITLLYRLQIRFGDPQPIGDLFSKGFIDYDETRDYTLEMSPPDSIMGSPMSELLMTAGPQWPAADIPAEYRTVRMSDVHTLMINGSIDFSTPIENARDELLDSLVNGHLVELRELGHVGDVYYNQPDAAENLVLRFLHEGIVDQSKFHHAPFEFKPENSFVFMMKIGMLGLGFLLLLAVILLVWGVRRIRSV
jgi:pimeloyl-ACP methyl ester carboxylesterase